jgi:hypothetical protein
MLWSVVRVVDVDSVVDSFVDSSKLGDIDSMDYLLVRRPSLLKCYYGYLIYCYQKNHLRPKEKYN